jgi:ATP-binding cassette subfamily C protein
VTQERANLAEGARFLRGALGSRRRALARLAGYSLLEGLPSFVSGLFIATAIDRGFLAGRFWVGAAWLAALAAAWVVGAFGTRQAYPWLAEIVEPLRDTLLSRLVAASLGSALRDEDAAGGATVARATVQVEIVRALFSSLLRILRQLLTSCIAAVGGLATLSPVLALCALLFLGVAVLLFVALLPVLVARYRAVVLAEEQIGERAAPVVTGVRDVVAAGAQEHAARDVGEAIDAAARATRAFARARAWRLPVVALGADFPLLALLAAAPWLRTHDRLTVGDIAGGVVYLSAGLEPAVRLLVNAAGTVLVTLGVVLGRLAEACREPDAPLGAIGGVRPCGYAVRLDGVTFRYAEHAAPVLRELRLEIPAGEHLAVVGPSGAGKSTLADLLAGLLRPQEGSVLLGGVPLEDLDERELRRTVALLPQEGYIFAGSVRENLAYLCPDADDDAVTRAAAAVGLDATVAVLGGLDAELDPRSPILTPGTRQRIALARAQLSPAAVVVLDEATSHLDPAAEADAERLLADRPGTLVVIAHRISSALRADRILVLDGAAAVVGRHEELLRTSPLYAELVGYWADAPDAPDVPGVAGPTARCPVGAPDGLFRL